MIFRIIILTKFTFRKFSRNPYTSKIKNEIFRSGGSEHSCMCVYVYVYIRVLACVRVRMCVRASLCLRACVCVFIFVCLWVSVCVSVLFLLPFSFHFSTILLRDYHRHRKFCTPELMHISLPQVSLLRSMTGLFEPWPKVVEWSWLVGKGVEWWVVE